MPVQKDSLSVGRETRAGGRRKAPLPKESGWISVPFIASDTSLSDSLPFGLQPYLADKQVAGSTVMGKTHLTFLMDKLIS